jgi:hypothetical protein
LLATACGYGSEEIDGMTLPRFDRLCRYWSKHPPLHLLVGAYFGFPKPERRNALGELLTMFGAGGTSGA